MTTLEDKILGEKRHYYCSSSSSNNSSDSENDEIAESSSKLNASSKQGLENVNKTLKVPNMRNTGPKGVLDDKQYYEYLKEKEREKNNSESYELIKKLALTCSSVLEDEKTQENENDPFSDNFLNQYRKKRMLEMLSRTKCNRKFGKLIDLTKSSLFLEAIDKEDETTLIIIHVCSNISLCKKINDMLTVLAEEHKNVKFCKILSTTAGLSLNFKISGIPALLVYKNKQLIGNFVRITDELGEDFCESDIENFLIEHGILFNESCMITSNVQ